jgi:gamma-glutamyltranspeptidase/glutathione hydrolase
MARFGRLGFGAGLAAALLATVAPAAAAAGEVEAFRGRGGMVVSASAPASEVGAAILGRGGNAVDAAVATAFAMAVTWPAAGNIGGGGFLLVHPAPGGGKPKVIDYRETAPAAADEHLFVDGRARSRLAWAGVPGTVAGLHAAHSLYGRLPWKDLVAPAEALARGGFPVEASTAELVNAALSDADPSFTQTFRNPLGRRWEAGDRLVQPELAETLRRIAEDGPDDFYRGRTAEAIVAAMKDGGGLITASDLASYRARVEEPANTTYRGYDVYAPGPPAGGATLIEILNIAETFDLRSLGRDSPEALHLTIEAMRRAFRDRAAYGGDPAFTPPHDELTSKQYAQSLAAAIDRRKATPSRSIAQEIPLSEGRDTTHFSVIDRDGMAVSNTYTLEAMFGARTVAAGFVLNNEMGDFNRRPGQTDQSGSIGTAPNLVAPGKRMLSAQSPTIVARDGRVVLVTGAPGGRAIPNTVAQILLNILEYGLDPVEAVRASRLHHSWFPDRVTFEILPGETAPASLAKLRSDFGHEIVPTRERSGDAHTIWVERPGEYLGIVDRKRGGKAAAPQRRSEASSSP